MPSDSTKKLQDAIRKLEMFSHQVHERRLETPLKKAISLFRSLVASSSSLCEDPEGLLQAVEVVNRGRLLIQKLKAAALRNALWQVPFPNQ